MTNVEQIQWDEARDAVYSFLSQAFLRGPSQAFLDALVSPEGLRELQEIFPDAAYQRELVSVRLDLQEGGLTREEACLDFEALFRVPGSRYLAPYESVYRSQSTGGRGRLCGPEAVAVERLYLKEGLGPSPEFSDHPDHIGVELEFMAFLCREAAAARCAGDPLLVAKYQCKQHKFYQEHLGAWAKLLAALLASQAQTSLYRFLGNFLSLFLELEDNLTFPWEGERMPARSVGAALEQGAGQ